MRTMRSSPTQAARTYHRIRSGHTFPKHNFITYVVANPPIRFVMSLCFISYFITSALLLQIPIKQRKSPRHRLRLFFVESGNVLLSQVVSNQVPSALKGLTSVFGMGTGGSLSPLSPENCEGFVQSFVFLVSAPSLHNRSFHLGDSPHISRFIFYCAYPENRTSRLLTSCITSFPIFPLVSTQFS